MARRGAGGVSRAGVRGGARRHATGRLRRVPRERPDRADGDGLRAGRPALRRRAGRQAARDQERDRCSRRRSSRSTVDSARRARAARRRLRPELRVEPVRLRLLHRPRRRRIHNRVSRFTANGDVAVGRQRGRRSSTSTTCRGATNHNGGAIHFGPDGKLYVAVGENANGANAQTLDNLLGKILRINADGSIPTDNPFFSTATGDNRAIWALGLRNPFTFAFQPGTGRMFINDVGQSTWEEINDGDRRRQLRLADDGGRDDRTRASAARSSPTATAAARRPAARSPAARSTTRRRRSSRPTTSATTSSPTSAAAGSARSTRRPGTRSTGFATGAASPVDLLVSDDGSAPVPHAGLGRLRLPRRPHGAGDGGNVAAGASRCSSTASRARRRPRRRASWASSTRWRRRRCSGGRAAVPVRRLVGRRRARSHDPHARLQHDVHGDLRPLTHP